MTEQPQPLSEERLAEIDALIAAWHEPRCQDIESRTALDDLRREIARLRAPAPAPNSESLAQPSPLHTVPSITSNGTASQQLPAPSEARRLAECVLAAAEARLRRCNIRRDEIARQHRDVVVDRLAERVVRDEDAEKLQALARAVIEAEQREAALRGENDRAGCMMLDLQAQVMALQGRIERARAYAAGAQMDARVLGDGRTETMMRQVGDILAGEAEPGVGRG